MKDQIGGWFRDQWLRLLCEVASAVPPLDWKSDSLISISTAGGFKFAMMNFWVSVATSPANSEWGGAVDYLRPTNVCRRHPRIPTW